MTVNRENINGCNTCFSLFGNSHVYSGRSYIKEFVVFGLLTKWPKFSHRYLILNSVLAPITASKRASKLGGDCEPRWNLNVLCELSNSPCSWSKVVTTPRINSALSILCFTQAWMGKTFNIVIKLTLYGGENSQNFQICVQLLNLHCASMYPSATGINIISIYREAFSRKLM